MASVQLVESPEASAIDQIVRKQTPASERRFCKLTSERPWAIFGPERMTTYVRVALDGPPTGPALHFFSSEAPVAGVEQLTRSIAAADWTTLEDLDLVLRRFGFLGTIRVTQVHNLDPAVEDLVASCSRLRRQDPNSYGSREQVLSRFHDGHGGVNAYYSMRGSPQAIPFHRDPGDVFAFQGLGVKLWELGSGTTLYGGGYSDTSAAAHLAIETRANEVLFLPRGIRHRARVSDDAPSLHFSLMTETAPEYWVLSGLAEALRTLPLFNGMVSDQ